MAQTYKFGNGTWANKEGSTLAYNDENNAFKPLPFSFTRDSIATRVNKEGLIEVVGKDIPRIDYLDDVKGALLLEPSRANLAIQSSIENMGGSGSNTGVVEFGNLNNGLESAEITVNGQRKWYFSTANIVAGTEYTVSFYVDSFDLSSSNRPIFYIPTEGTNGISSIYGFQIVLGRNEKTFTATANGSQFRIGLGISSNDVGSIKLGGLQIEQGSYATSYIPTSGSTVQRAAETANGSGNSEVFNSQEGILFTEGMLINDDGTSNNITLGDNTFSNNRMMLLFSNGVANRITARFDSSGSDVTLNADGYDLTINHKVLLKYKANDIAIWVDGFEVNSGSSFSAPTLLNRIDFYNPFGSGQDNFYGKTKEIGYYDTALTDLELETLTSYRSLNELVTELNLNTL